MRRASATVILAIVALLVATGSLPRGPTPSTGGDAPATRHVAAHGAKPSRLTSTYSIVAFDPETGQLGVAVQSHVPYVGAIVPWAEPRVGAVATQAIADTSFGRLGLDLMRGGKSAPATLKSLLAADEGAEKRQVAMIDAKGNVAVHTGKRCIEAAGHSTGKNYAVQANLMANDRVWPAMARAFEAARGDLAERMLAALDAAQQAGGDFRGMQSAALVVVTGKPTGDPLTDRLYDLRVDDSRDPLKDLRRLVNIRRADLEVWDIDEKTNPKEVLRRLAVAEKSFPDDAELLFWTAVALAKGGHMDEALPLFKRVFTLDKKWKGLIPRLVKAGELPDDQERLKRILEVSKE